MDRPTSILAIVAATGLMASAIAQDRDRDRDRTRDPAADRDRIQEQARDQDRQTDRDRVLDRDLDRLQDRDRDRDTDRTADQDRDRDRDRLHVQDRDRLRTRDIYGAELMSRQERNEYRNRVRRMTSDREWAQFRMEHQNRMLARARERGVTLPAPFYGQQLMTDREREQHRERLENANTEQERARIRAEHRSQMQERAREMQIPLSDLGS